MSGNPSFTQNERLSTIQRSTTTVEAVIKLDESKVSKKGQLFKRGGIFRGYASKYMFYLEENFLKYGKKGKPLTASIDLSEAMIERHEESRKKFRIHCGGQTLALKADTSKEREEWIEALGKIPKRSNHHSFIQRNSYQNKENHNQNTQKRKLSSKKSSQKRITLNQITEMIQSQDSKLNKMISQSYQSLDGFCQKLVTFEQDNLDKKQKEKFIPIKEELGDFKVEMKIVFDLIGQLNQSLYRIVEIIAEKEIQKDPMEFIKNESFVQPPSEKFHSLNNNNNFLANIHMVHDITEESKEEDTIYTEYRLDQYNNNDFQFEESKEMPSGGSGGSGGIDQNQLVEQLEEIFHDAKDYFPSASFKSNRAENDLIVTIQPNGGMIGEVDDPPERMALPYFKDPKMRISLWTILKDSLGKDITKMSVPVYFNDPTNILQRVATTCEYNYLFDEALKIQDPLKRLAYVCLHQITTVANLEKNTTKPFNPLLGETFELVTDKFQFISELVCHHPPITAWECKGNSGYRKWSCSRARQKFTGRALLLNAQYKDYVEFEPFNEKYEVANATVSVHNLIVGTMYLDVRDKAIIRSLTRPGEIGVISFHERGWNANSYYKVTAEIFNSKKEVVYKIEGKWNESLTLINCRTGEKEIAWRKTPYPENVQYQYGFSHFMIQLNYLPNFLRKQIAPTDTRLRPDQRLLENGDLKLAQEEKTRLEEKQRVVRRYNEKNGLTHKAAYFYEWENPDDNGMVYWRYNGLYFDKDRKEKDWSRLPDIFSDYLPKEIEEFQKGTPQDNKKKN